METVVDQTLGNIQPAGCRFLLSMGEYQEYIRAPHAHRDRYTVPRTRLQTAGNVVSVKNRDPTCLLQAFCAHRGCTSS